MPDALDQRAAPRRRRRRVIILLVFTGIIVALIYAFRAVLTPFLVALFTAYMLGPLVERMAPLRLFKRFTLGRGGSIAILYLILIGAAYIGVSFSIPALGRQLKQAQTDLPKAQAIVEEQIQKFAEKAQDWWGDKPTPEVDDDAPEDEGDTLALPGPSRSRFHLKGGGAIEAEIVARDDRQAVLRLGTEFRVLDLETVEREEQLEAATVAPNQWTKLIVAELGTRLGDVLRITVSVIGTVVSTFVQLFLILMVTAFLLIDAQAIVRFIQSVPPRRYQAVWQHLIVYIDRGLAGVIRGQLMICLVNGLLTWIGLEFLGVPYSGLLGFIAGVFSLIPVFGTILSTIPIVLIAWGSGEFSDGFLALGWILLIHFIEANFLNPKIMGTASKIHPVVVIFALIAGEHAYGIVGALLAVPTASIVQSCFKFYVVDKQHEVLDTQPEEAEDDELATASA
ncbi:MAG: AI-2E family transporter [Planctomycetota bacterium]|jgi:predicted PurR-regulated permease PerM